MLVDLVTNDGSKVLAQVEVPNFPSDPKIVVWKDADGKLHAFLAAFGFGPNPYRYIENSLFVVPEPQNGQSA